MAYKRWYDFDPKLSTVIQTMSRLESSSCRAFSVKLLELSTILLADRGGENYLENLDNRKKDGLRKSEAKKRWYDQDEVLYQAFNNLYALHPMVRWEIATLMSTPIRIVEGYERYCHHQGRQPDGAIVEEIMRTCLVDGPERASRLYTVYLTALRKKPAASSNSEHPKGIWTTILESLQNALAPA